MSTMEELWFEEEIVVADNIALQMAQSIAVHSKAEPKDVSQQIKNQARGIIRLFKPRWKLLDPKLNRVIKNKNDFSQCYLVRLGIEFDIPTDLRKKGTRFTEIRFSTYIWATQNLLPKPSVYEIFPKTIYDGEPQKISLRLGPEITFEKVGGSLGELSTDLVVGQLSPFIVGFIGEEERFPYWVLKSKNKELVGSQHFWMILEFPKGHKSVRLATRVEASLQTFVGPISIGPSLRQWESRPSVVIE
jgi:hypothetical protein